VIGQGRIPVVVAVGLAGPEGLGQALAQALPGRCVGVASRAGLWVAGRREAPAARSALAAGQALLADTRVDVALLCVDTEADLADGLAADRFDVLALAGPPTGVQDDAAWERWRRHAAMLAGASRAGVLMDEHCAGWRPLLSAQAPNRARAVAPSQWAQALKDALMEPGNET
jgi:hypothetical protein